MDLSRRTVANPNPEDPPVTITTRFVSIFMIDNKVDLFDGIDGLVMSEKLKIEIKSKPVRF
jgi:hypothetical protein